MEKLTLDIKDMELITWAKNYARSNSTSVRILFESHIRALKEFEKIEVKLSPELQNLRDPGQRPTEKEIEKHLVQRRK
ncbi:DUF6364 family protein [Aquiflexum sp.]|uniref:DUF6364 family protein n=1 Tax=Aquiflexum sp. TaxID=1872584 RepID=UPI0035936838